MLPRWNGVGKLSNPFYAREYITTRIYANTRTFINRVIYNHWRNIKRLARAK